MTRAGFMKGDPEKAMTKVNRAMCVDGFGLWLGAIIGSNSITCYIESNTGIEAGARTGFASIVTGCAFLLSLLFIAPFVASACSKALRGCCCAHALTRAPPLRSHPGCGHHLRPCHGWRVQPRRRQGHQLRRHDRPAVRV